jgi:hypothetical protein
MPFQLTELISGAFFAYLDPGSGSLIVQIVVGAIAGSALVVKLYWRKFKSLFSKDEEESGTEEKEASAS